jgi:ATP-dependent DNA helicase RecQ
MRLLRRAAESAGVPLGVGPPPVDRAGRDLKARRDRERLDTMIRYAFSRGCRTRFIYDYFAGGARGGAAPRCGVCDVCLGWRKGVARPLDDEEVLEVRIALSAVGRLSGRFGVERIAQVLIGSSGKEIMSRGLDRIPTYGKLSGVKLDRVKSLLGTLADAGLVERRGIEGGKPGAFVLALTPEGRAVALGRVRPELDLQPRSPASRSTIDPQRKTASTQTRAVDADLLGRLKGWRMDEARKRSVPPYVIFHDRTLAEVAAVRPGDLDNLAKIKGIGPAKLAAYGEELLRLLG